MLSLTLYLLSSFSPKAPIINTSKIDLSTLQLPDIFKLSTFQHNPQLIYKKFQENIYFSNWQWITLDGIIWIVGRG
jgi:hypothetical protein